ncbi:MAG: type IV toxin-antitoxin system AbiEi family antitoxin [Lacisediminihabitans sp.]
MSPRLPSVLSRLNLPEAELYAARLDGEVFAIDDCFSPIDEIEGSGHRARSLLPTPSMRLVAERETAAWVLGAVNRPPTRHQFCTTVSARVRVSSGLRLDVREVVLDNTEILVIDGLRVTTPLRTAIDLARFSADFGYRESVMVAALMTLGAFGVEDCADSMNRRKNLPRKQHALARISEAAGQKTRARA